MAILMDASLNVHNIRTFIITNAIPIPIPIAITITITINIVVGSVRCMPRLI